MKFVLKTMNQKISFALGVLTLMPLSANALLINTSTVSFSNSANVSDTQGGGASNNNGASLGTTSISQFNPNQGVLIGTTLHLVSTRTQSTWVQSADGPNTGSNGNVTSNGTGSSTAQISGPGLDVTFLPAITNSDTCSDHRRGGCTGTATVSAGAATNINQAVSAANLDGYVGSGDVTLARSAPTLTATQTDNKFTGDEKTEHTVTWAGSVSASYDFLLHAAPSFDASSTMLTLNLDFGTFYLGDAATLGFSLFNLADGNRVGLDLDSISSTGDVGALMTNLDIFSSLAQGSSQSWWAMLDTSATGLFNTSYLLNFSDANIGAASSRASYSMTLNLTGRVDELSTPPQDVNAIPEPGTFALLGLGLAGLGFVRRQKSS